MILQTLHQHLLQKFPQLKKWNNPHNNTISCFINPHNHQYIRIIITNTTINLQTRQPHDYRIKTEQTIDLNDPTSTQQIEKTIQQYL